LPIIRYFKFTETEFPGEDERKEHVENEFVESVINVGIKARFTHFHKLVKITYLFLLFLVFLVYFWFEDFEAPVYYLNKNEDNWKTIITLLRL
jgi:hypothetical protein